MTIVSFGFAAGLAPFACSHLPASDVGGPALKFVFLKQAQQVIRRRLLYLKLLTSVPAQHRF